MQLISEIEDERSINIICDELGSVILKGDKEFEYGEFGEALGDKPENFGFAGLTVDEISGNYLSATRMYDENLGRFLEKDKIKGNLYYGFTQNEYIYCYNSPLVFVDSTGNAPVVNSFHFISPVSNWQVEVAVHAAENVKNWKAPRISNLLNPLHVELAEGFLEYMPEEIPDMVMNVGHNIWNEEIPYYKKVAISTIGYIGIRELRAAVEISGFSDYINEQTV